MTPYPWKVYLAPEGSAHFRVATAPNRLHRWLQRVVLGVRWEFVP
jgi:hypothetical protein